MSTPSTSTTATLKRPAPDPPPGRAGAGPGATGGQSLEITPRLRLAIMRLSRLLRQYADPETGLSQSLISALATVQRCHGPVTLGRLAELERIQPPSMTRIVAQLEERGLLVREIDPTDRRVARVRTTPAADGLIMELRTRKNEYLAGLLAELTADELRSLEGALPVLERLAGVPD